LKILQTSYFWRTFGSYSAFILASILLVGLLQGISLRRLEISQDASNLQTQTVLLRRAAYSPLKTGDIETIRDLGRLIGEQTGMRITVMQSDGLVLADNMETPDIMENHLLRPEIQQALSRGTGEVERYSQTLNKTFVYRAEPVFDEERLLGMVRAGRAREDLNAQIRNQIMLVFRHGTEVILLLLLAAFALALRKAATVVLLTETTEAIANGDFERRVPESRALGMKRLADAINQMARLSAKRLATLTADRNRLAAIFTGMVEGVIDVDERQHIVHINEAAAKLLGIQGERCIGKPVWQEVRNQAITQAVDQALQNRSVIKTQVDYLRERSQLTLDLYVASLADDQGQPIGAILVVHDVTELRHLERIRTDFVANASHELKTPITAIRGLAETVVSDPEVDRDTLLHFMERIQAQSIRLSHLVVDLMTISRLEADHGRESFTIINLVDLVGRAVVAATPAAEQKQLSLTSRLSQDRLEVYGDRQNLSQLVDNLIDNAVKYTPENGRVEVRLRQEDADLVLEVEDSGIGISPQFLERVFERFYRVDKARSQSLGGTGLGLSIVRNIAERHGGTVGVKSQPGKGSMFTFRMPLAAGSWQQAVGSLNTGISC
jgi:two-component system, OmpR family, phosphate regulon sensor histidine kinase PhoR